MILEYTCCISTLFVPKNIVKNILTQADPEGRRGQWIAIILEYDLEIKPTKLIQGLGLVMLMEELNCNSFQISCISNMSTYQAKS